MPNIRLILEYNGLRFHGWQKQSGVHTVEEELHRALELVLREKIHAIYGSGRTDAGVHARGQVANFHCEQTPDLFRMTHAVSSIFRGRLAVVGAEIVPDDFHSRYNAKKKQYSYTIINRPGPPTIDRGRAWHVTAKLDFEAMKREAAVLVGTHDFTSLRGYRCSAKSPVREIYESEVTWNAPFLTYRVVGQGFLKQMVRIIVGTLVGIGKGVQEPASMREILDCKERTAAGVTAPAYGLCLDWVEYPAFTTESGQPPQK